MSTPPTGVQTNGVGKVSTAHLNLARSLADVWANEAAPAEPAKADPGGEAMNA